MWLLLLQCDLGMVGNVASTVSNVVDMGRPEVAAACCFAAMVGGNMDDVRDITCKMIDQVRGLFAFFTVEETQSTSCQQKWWKYGFCAHSAVAAFCSVSACMLS